MLTLSENEFFPAVAGAAAMLAAMIAVVFVQMAKARQTVRRRAFQAVYAADMPSLDRGNQALAGHLDLDGIAAKLADLDRSRRNSASSKLRSELAAAGYFNDDAVSWYYAARIGLAALLAIAVLVIVPAVVPQMSEERLLPLALAAAAGGLLIPAMILQQRQVLGREQCANAFPGMLDLLVICAEAGLSPRMSLEFVGSEFGRTAPFFAAHLRLTILQIRAGSQLQSALDDFGRRIELDEMRSLAAVLQQSESLGTGIAATLRAFSSDTRAKRLLRAEEKAHKLPVKLIMPLALFVFPALLLVIFLPVMIRVGSVFKP